MIGLPADQNTAYDCVGDRAAAPSDRVCVTPAVRERSRAAPAHVSVDRLVLSRVDEVGLVPDPCGCSVLLGASTGATRPNEDRPCPFWGLDRQRSDSGSVRRPVRYDLDTTNRLLAGFVRQPRGKALAAVAEVDACRVAKLLDLATATRACVIGLRAASGVRCRASQVRRSCYLGVGVARSHPSHPAIVAARVSASRSRRSMSSRTEFQKPGSLRSMPTIAMSWCRLRDRPAASIAR